MSDAPLTSNLVVFLEEPDKHGLMRQSRVGPLSQVVSQYTDEIERLTAWQKQAADTQQTQFSLICQHEDTIDRLRAALVDVEARPDERKRYYDFRQYMSHINGCKGGGDQQCACGKAQTAWNLEELIDSAERAHEALRPAHETNDGKA